MGAVGQLKKLQYFYTPKSFTMKKVLLLLAAVILLQQANAQSFQKGSLVISLDWGFDVYTLNESYSINNKPNSTTTQTDHAASSNFNLGAEYGLLKWLGAGLQFKLDNYFTSVDSTTGHKPSARGIEVGVLINGHIVRANHFDLLAGFNFGFSHFTYNYNDGFSDQVYGNGSWRDFHITPRFYFGKFGLNLTLYFPLVNYPSLTSNFSSALGEDIIATWKANGVGVNLGIHYRFIH